MFLPRFQIEVNSPNMLLLVLHRQDLFICREKKHFQRSVESPAAVTWLIRRKQYWNHGSSYKQFTMRRLERSTGGLLAAERFKLRHKTARYLSCLVSLSFFGQCWEVSVSVRQAESMGWRYLRWCYPNIIVKSFFWAKRTCHYSCISRNWTCWNGLDAWIYRTGVTGIVHFEHNCCQYRDQTGWQSMDRNSGLVWSFDQLLQHSREINKLSYSKYCNIQLIRWWTLNIRQ